ncbi:MAG: AMP-binding protein, partial [Verrucomicrobia bacterium]|nr:AMP-binding protein [Verrucomicrobiota bacterium]
MQPIPTANPPHLGTKDHSVWTLFQTCAHHHPSSVALRSSSQTLTYAELQRSAENLSSWLAQSNITSGDRVAVLLSNPIHAIEHFLALARLGASYVPLDSTTHDALLWPILKIADVSAIVLDPD